MEVLSALRADHWLRAEFVHGQRVALSSLPTIFQFGQPKGLDSKNCNGRAPLVIAIYPTPEQALSAR